MRRTTRSASVLVLLLCLSWPVLPLSAGGEGEGEGFREYTNPLAFRWLRRGAYGAAGRQFEQEHEARPRAGGPLAGLALCECRQGQIAAARAHAESARSLDPDQPLLYAALACLHEADGEFAAAEAEYALATQSSFLPLYSTYEIAFQLRHGQYVAAFAGVEAMERSGTVGPSTDSIAVQCLLALGDVDTAGLLSEGIRTAGRSPRAGQSLVTLVALAQPVLVGEAASGYRYFVPSDGSVDRAVLLRAEVKRRLGELDEAEELVGRRKREPREPVGEAVVVRVAIDLGAFGDARARLAAAQLSWPMHPSLLLSEALLAARQGDRAAAERALVLARSAGIPAWDTAVDHDVEMLLAGP